MLRKIFSYSSLLLLAAAVAFVTPGVSRAQHGGGGHGGGGHFGGGHFGGAHFSGGHFGGAGFSGYRGGSYRGGYNYGHHYYPHYGHYGYHHYPYYGVYNYYPYYGDYYPYYYDTYPYISSNATYDSGYTGSSISTDAYGSYPSVSSGATYDSGYSISSISTPPYPYSDPSLQSDLRNVVHITARVPADAELWFEGSKTVSKGPVRVFQSPPLTPGVRYTYDLRARWNENGHEVTQTQKVEVTAGDDINVSFPMPSKTAGQASAVPNG